MPPNVAVLCLRVHMCLCVSNAHANMHMLLMNNDVRMDWAIYLAAAGRSISKSISACWQELPSPFGYFNPTSSCNGENVYFNSLKNVQVDWFSWIKLNINNSEAEMYNILCRRYVHQKHVQRRILMLLVQWYNTNFNAHVTHTLSDRGHERDGQTQFTIGR